MIDGLCWMVLALLGSFPLSRSGQEQLTEHTPFRRRSSAECRHDGNGLAIRDDQPAFDEFLMLMEEGGGLELHLKHFNPDSTGWEENEKSLSFPFVVKVGKTITFQGLAFQADGSNALTTREQVFRMTGVSNRN